MQKKSLIGILGGTFNPIHVGHLRCAIELREQLKLKQVHLIPSNTPPHRNAPSVSAKHRYHMVKLATENEPNLIADDSELRRPGPSYMVDTLAQLRQQQPNQHHLALIVGVDAFLKITSWYQWQRLFDLAHIIVISRPNQPFVITDSTLETLTSKNQVDTLDALYHTNAGHIYYQPVTAWDISSTKIRQRVKNDLSIRFLVADSVLAYINENKFYGKPAITR